jgi:hypothetical protein
VASDAGARRGSGEAVVARGDLPVSNLAASLTWYESVLGCQVIYEAPGYAWCSMTSPVPGMRIGIGEAEQVKMEGGATPTLAPSAMSVAW